MRAAEAPTPLELLVVDDEAEIRDAIVEILRRLGYRAVPALDGRDALDQLASGLRPCAILLDWSMPRLGGDGFLTARAASSALTEIPVFVISGQTEPARDARIQGFLEKPFQVAEVVALLRGVCVDRCAVADCVSQRRHGGA